MSCANKVSFRTIFTDWSSCWCSIFFDYKQCLFYLILQMGALMFHKLCIFHNNNTCQLPRRSIYFTLMDIKMKYFPPCEFYCFFSAKQFLPKFSLMHHTHLTVLKKKKFLPVLLFFTSTLLNIYTCLFCFCIRLINADVL